MNWKLLHELCDTPGAPGHEQAVAEIMRREFAELTDDVITDNVGNVIAHIPGEGRRVALDAHTDEVGFIVSHVDGEGFIRVIPLGGVDPRVFTAQRVIVHGKRELLGVVGSIPPHLTRGNEADRDKSVSIEESFIDVGLPADTVRELVKVGDIVTFDSKLTDIGDAFVGKAFDDRAGLFAMVEGVRHAKKIACDLFLVAAVQEERGLRGAQPAAFTVAPDIAIAIEGTFANDFPGIPSHKRLATQDKGPELRIVDGRVIADRGLVDFLGNIAEEEGILHQFIVKSAGTTNATAIQTSRGGVRVAAISMPVRYIHSPTGLVRKKDIEGTVRLVSAFLENADRL
ncbi:MAG TPA: M42 family peptidase [candidate division Zixibacteria bacterium]|nr:M42 family peptidase [candidate division Zixibacteria bacterium]